MSLDRLLIHTITVHHMIAGDPATDLQGNPITVEDEGTALRARVEARVASEDDVDRQTRVTDYLVFLPADTDIGAIDRVVWEGRDHEVIGRPQVMDGRSGPHHVEMVMRLKEA